MDASTWRELLGTDDCLEVHRSAGLGELADAERRLNIELPTEIRGLYEATDGVFHKPGQWFLVWKLQDVVERNVEAWNGAAPEARRHLLAFGDDGTGDPFCVALDGDPAVMSWSPISAEIQPLAPTLRDFWLRWLAGTIVT